MICYFLLFDPALRNRFRTFSSYYYCCCYYFTSLSLLTQLDGCGSIALTQGSSHSALFSEGILEKYSQKKQSMGIKEAVNKEATGFPRPQTQSFKNLQTNDIVNM